MLKSSCLKYSMLFMGLLVIHFAGQPVHSEVKPGVKTDAKAETKPAAKVNGAQANRLKKAIADTTKDTAPQVYKKHLAQVESDLASTKPLPQGTMGHIFLALNAALVANNPANVDKVLNTIVKVAFHTPSVTANPDHAPFIYLQAFTTGLVSNKTQWKAKFYDLPLPASATEDQKQKILILGCTDYSTARPGENLKQHCEALMQKKLPPRLLIAGATQLALIYRAENNKEKYEQTLKIISDFVDNKASMDTLVGFEANGLDGVLNRLQTLGFSKQIAPRMEAIVAPCRPSPERICRSIEMLDVNLLMDLNQMDTAKERLKKYKPKWLSNEDFVILYWVSLMQIQLAQGDANGARASKLNLENLDTKSADTKFAQFQGILRWCYFNKKYEEGNRLIKAFTPKYLASEQNYTLFRYIGGLHMITPNLLLGDQIKQSADLLDDLTAKLKDYNKRNGLNTTNCSLETARLTQSVFDHKERAINAKACEGQPEREQMVFNYLTAAKSCDSAQMSQLSTKLNTLLKPQDTRRDLMLAITKNCEKPKEKAEAKP